jgi:hypothetical protein
VTKEVTNEVREVAKYVIDNGDLVVITMRFYDNITIVSKTRIPCASITGHSLSVSCEFGHQLVLEIDTSLTFEQEIYQNGEIFNYKEVN